MLSVDRNLFTSVSVINYQNESVELPGEFHLEN